MRPPRRRRGRAPSASTDHAAREDCQNRVADEVEGSVSPTSRGSASTISTPVPPPVSLCAADAFATGTIGDDPRHRDQRRDEERERERGDAVPPAAPIDTIASIGVVVAVGFAVGPDHTRLFTARKVIGHEASTSGLTSCRTETARQYGRRFRRSNVMRTPSCRLFLPGFSLPPLIYRDGDRRSSM